VDERSLRFLLAAVRAGRLSPDQAVERLKDLPFVRAGESRPDLHRELRTGQAEAVYGPGKTPAEVRDILAALLKTPGGPVFVTKASADQAAAARAVAPDAEYHPRSGLLVARVTDEAPAGTVLIVTAGTADLPVAEEATETARALGLKADLVADVGVAGVHRLLAHRAALEAADCLIVVAGMEGALPSLVAGLTSRPVVAVPTSVGYGASFDGLAALLAMLNACAAGVGVVNIDNGFGAAQLAHRIVRRRDV